MANRERGEVALRIGERDLVLRLTTNSCCELEDRSGKSFEDWNAEWAKKHLMTAFRWMVWAALQDQHTAEAKTPEAAGKLIDQCDQAALMRVMTSFLLLQSDEFKQLIKAGVLQSVKESAAGNPQTAQADPAGVDSISMLASSV